MGSEPYWYIVPYARVIEDALEQLRQREFRAGRYNPVTPLPEFPVDPDDPGPGAEHDSIEEAMEDAAEDGTRSILDLESVGEEPDFCVAARLPDEVLLSLYRTTKPTRAMIEAYPPLAEDLERGHGVYTIVYENDQPTEIFFGGFSFD